MTPYVKLAILYALRISKEHQDDANYGCSLGCHIGKEDYFDYETHIQELVDKEL